MHGHHFLTRLGNICTKTREGLVRVHGHVHQTHPEAFDEGTYYFDDLKNYRKGNWTTGKIIIDNDYGLRILDLKNDQNWVPQRHGTIQYSRWLPAWDPVSRVFTKMLRWDGCMKGRSYVTPCDSGGWFPLQEICKRDLGGLKVTMEPVFNIVANDDKGRFQIC